MSSASSKPTNRPSGLALRTHRYEQRLRSWDFSTRYVLESEKDSLYLEGYEWTGAVVPGPYGTELFEMRKGDSLGREVRDSD